MNWILGGGIFWSVVGVVYLFAGAFINDEDAGKIGLHMILVGILYSGFYLLFG